MPRSDEEERNLQIAEGNIVPRTPPELPSRDPDTPRAAGHPPLPPRDKTPSNTVDLSKLPIIWTYQDAGSYGKYLGEKFGSATQWAAHRNPLRIKSISEIYTAEDNRPIRIEFTQDIGEFKNGKSIQLHNKDAVIQFIRDNYAGMVGGGKRSKRKTHKRKSHRRKSHKRKSHKRKSHKRKRTRRRR
jgi:hypothetical protein